MSGLRERTVGLTGAAGFIGSFVAAELARFGAHVIALDGDPGSRAHLTNLIDRGAVEFVSTGCRWPFPGLTDRRSDSHWSACLGRLDSLIHLGYREPTAGDMLGEYREELAANVMPTMALLERLPPSVAVYFASSSLVYGRDHRRPIDESTPARPDTPYGLAKLGVERALSWWAGDDRSAVALRIATVYGPTETVPRAVPNFIRRTLGGLDPVVAVGEDERDYVHVTDVARAVATVMADSTPGLQVLNVGTGRAVTTLELARRIIELIDGRRAPVVSESPRPPVSVVVDPAKLARLTGWKAEVDLSRGLLGEIEWFRRHPELWSRDTEVGCS